jgi:hypothetical protein
LATTWSFWASGKAETMNFADDGIARDAAEFGGDG